MSNGLIIEFFLHLMSVLILILNCSNITSSYHLKRLLVHHDRHSSNQNHYYLPNQPSQLLHQFDLQHPFLLTIVLTFLQLQANLDPPYYLAHHFGPTDYILCCCCFLIQYPSVQLFL